MKFFDSGSKGLIDTVDQSLPKFPVVEKYSSAGMVGDAACSARHLKRRGQRSNQFTP
jgi:hypothetical protein